MSGEAAEQADGEGIEGDFSKELGRAFGGAVVFSMPMLMTMEMWFFGFYLDRVRVALFTLLAFALLVGLTRTVGFKSGSHRPWREGIVDAGVAYLVGFLTAAGFLWVMSIIGDGRGWSIGLNIVILQAVPAAVGAAFARGALGGQQPDKSKERYAEEMFLVVAGSVTFAFNVAPTEEMILIGYRMSALHSAILVIGSAALMHALVYTIELPGTTTAARGPLHALAVYTLPGYAAVLLVSAYLLWTFGRLEGLSAAAVIGPPVVLALPGAVGAGAARLIL